ncbi:MAG: hypothetical protein WCW35_10555 [Bacteroidota bacterium]|jgi:hypothetical protein
MKRLILAIVAAILINGILATAIDHVFHTTGIYPPYGEPMHEFPMLLLAYSYRALITIFAAYITAMIAKEKAKTAIYFTGILGTLLWLAGSIAMWDAAAAWYNIIGILTALPLAITGWKLFERKSQQVIAQ